MVWNCLKPSGGLAEPIETGTSRSESRASAASSLTHAESSEALRPENDNGFCVAECLLYLPVKT